MVGNPYYPQGLPGKNKGEPGRFPGQVVSPIHRETSVLQAGQSGRVPKHGFRPRGGGDSPPYPEAPGPDDEEPPERLEGDTDADADTEAPSEPDPPAEEPSGSDETPDEPDTDTDADTGRVPDDNIPF